MEKKRRIAPDTMTVLELLAEGWSTRSVSESCGKSMHLVHNIRNRYRDVIAELQGKRMDGSPLRFEPGHGCESIAHMQKPEAAQEEPAPEPEEPRRHSIAELFREIDRLEGEKLKLMADCANAERERDEALDTAEMEVAKRKELENQLANAKSGASTETRMWLEFLLNEINASSVSSDYDFIRGMSYAISYGVFNRSDFDPPYIKRGIIDHADAEESVPAELE